MHGVSPIPAAHETPLRFSIYASTGCAASALVDLLTAAAGMDRTEGRSSTSASLSFATAQRAFIVETAQVGDLGPARGAIEASRAELSVVLIDAVAGLTSEGRRHVAVARAVGSRHLVLAVDGLERTGWDPTRYRGIAGEFAELSASLDFASVLAIPLSTELGDNVAAAGANTSWYRGPTLLAHLEHVPVDTERKQHPLRLLIERVAQSTDGAPPIRGILLSGSLCQGNAVASALSGATGTVERLLVDGAERDRATAGDEVAIELCGSLSVEPEDMLVDPSHRPHVAEQFAAHLVWLGTEPLFPSRDYLLRMCGREMAATVTSIKHRLDVDTLRHEPARTLEQREVGAVTIATPTPLALDAFADLPQTSRFALYDRYSRALIAAGTVDFVLRRGVNVHMQPLAVSKARRASLKGQEPCILWFTGLSGAGKSTIANLVEGQLAQRGSHTYLLDGDNVRHGLNKNLGFTAADRVENIRRVGEVAKLFVDAGLIVLCSFISPFRAERAAVRDLVGPAEFIEIFVRAPLAVCEQRDPKGLYAKSRAGELPNFTGIDSPYEEPESPDLVLDTTLAPASELARRVIALLEARKLIGATAARRA